jgi:glutamate synthase (NADPH/NADH) small chain
VAVVGSGPAGLACAAQLNQAGHLVTVFERDDRVGGLLVYGIPTMKLDKEIVQRRVDLLTEEGIKFVTNTEVGTDYPAEKLLAEFDAVTLCGGATSPRDLPIDGRDLDGIHFAMDFLKANTKSWLDHKHLDGHYISAEGLDVVVIGGGDTGTDCVATALRHNCRSLVQLEILPEPASDRTEDEPWPRWPNLFVTDYGHEEAKALFSDDPRQYTVMTTRFVGNENGRVNELHACQVDWVEKENGLVPEQRPGTERVYPAQLVLLAMGFLGPESKLLKELGVDQDASSNVMAEFGSYETSLPGVFAAGDMRRGQSLVVWAIREGRGAARQCDRYLMGETSLP